MAVLLIAEHNQEQLTHSTLATLTAAKAFGGPIHLVIMGHSCAKPALDASWYEGVSKVWTIEHPSLTHLIVENITPTLLERCRGYDFILASSTLLGKNLLPRLAALLNVAQLSDVVSIKDQNTFVRPIYAGNTLATISSHDRVKVMTIRETAFERAKRGTSVSPIESFSFFPPSTPCPRLVKMEKRLSKRPVLGEASIIVAGGRGIQSKEMFKLLEALADRLNAAIGASRPLVDKDFVSIDNLVGQTGKTVAPDLYIAVGISGAIQHITGMRDSKVIVAINKDPNAPLFQIADYGLVGDASLILPELLEKLLP